MKRAPIVLTATAAGLVGVLGFHAHAKTPALPPALITTSPPAASPSSSPSSSPPTRTVTSDVTSTRYGNVQLKVTVSGGRITGVQPVQLPVSDPKSSDISTYSEPLLRQSALSKQSANIDAVSGATYTSDGYKTALQSALDTAGFRAPAAGSSAS